MYAQSFNAQLFLRFHGMIPKTWSYELMFEFGDEGTNRAKIMPRIKH